MVNSYTEKDAINLTDLARKFTLSLNGKKADNGGAVIRTYLTSEGIDIMKFKRKKRGRPMSDSSGIRGKKLRIS